MTGKKHSHFSRAFASTATTVLIIGLGTHGITAQAGDSTFRGVAGLCAMSDDGSGLYYRIETSHDLINGWETLHSTAFTIPSGKKFFFGDAALHPDSAPGSTLEGKFLFPSDANPIKGRYVGTGELAGVSVTYELVPDKTIPSAYPKLCDGAAPMFGYRMTGTVHKHEER